MRLVETISGDLSPKSVVASGAGMVVAQNMMYRHTITVYDRSYRLVKTISDRVDLEALGGPAAAGPVRGAPVEAAFSPDARYAYVSNYSMYGPGYTREGSDRCSPGSAIDNSFVYRVDMARLAVDRVGPVGQVPKYVAATPDGRLVLVTNWCSYDLSVLSPRTLEPLRRVPLGAYPRGIAVDPWSRTAYVAVMGSTRVAVVDLASFAVRWIEGVGAGPRHLVMDPAGRWLYATLNAEGRVAKIDLRTGRVVARVATGAAPRSMTIAEDGRSLYVVNYGSGTVSKLRASDLRIVQVVPTNRHPIGITYDVHGGAGYVWVACYTGSIMVFKDA
jgi:YVTN family beta-propeller protein